MDGTPRLHPARPAHHRHDQRTKEFPLCGPMFDIQRHGERQTYVNQEILPHMAKMADKLTIIRSMNTEAINHDPAITYINTGTQQFGRPSLGSWLSYGLGSLSEDLPAYVVMISVGTSPGQALYARLWGGRILPSKHQGVQFRSGADPVLFLNNPKGLNRDLRRSMLDGLSTLNSERHAITQDPKTQARIAQYEMAFRMQASVPDLVDLKQEKESVYEAYYPDSKKPGSFASNCDPRPQDGRAGCPLHPAFPSRLGSTQQLTQERHGQLQSVDQPPPPSSRNWKNAGCWKIRLSSLVASSAAPSTAKASSRKTTTAATTMAVALRPAL